MSGTTEIGLHRSAVEAFPSSLSGPLLLDAEELGRLMRLTNSVRPGAGRAAVLQRMHRGYPMPPRVSLPGARRHVWLHTDVVEWLMRHRVSGDEIPISKDGEGLV